ncbi:hypothetical protein M419DRAFT_122423 [Trichoderma reesei RUT C-30]|uniref:Uncharacterized protein n=1 Tax=Hypocrea jecorina (strain ATCC 56765 / BCRC 32924 / NRRL 11460 / Rut C-30) TaxID=1344414 RepID=A0A024SHM2_HYPJR|nr:hypothetical protein M419DRAFT_122423 [Trichoderma reesei RUT C-30]
MLSIPYISIPCCCHISFSLLIIRSMLISCSKSFLAIHHTCIVFFPPQILVEQRK